MIRNFGLMIFLFVLAGCEKPPASSKVVSTNTQTDLRHDHKHLHGDSNRHDHQHADLFSGAHSHPHAHSHRHSAAPHGGEVVSLHLTTGDGPTPDLHGLDVPLRPHLEVVADIPEKISFYLLSENSQGEWTPWSIGPSSPTIDLTLGPSDLQIELKPHDEGGAFWTKLSSDTQAIFADQSKPVRISKLRLFIDELAFDVPETLVFQQGALDVVVK